jgi:hypothetical protein
MVVVPVPAIVNVIVLGIPSTLGYTLVEGMVATVVSLLVKLKYELLLVEVGTVTVIVLPVAYVVESGVMDRVPIIGVAFVTVNDAEVVAELL